METNPFKLNDFVTLKNVSTKNPDHEGRVSKVDGDYVEITNMNMPFCGSMCGKRFHFQDLNPP